MSSVNLQISGATARKIVLTLFILYAAAYSTLSILRHSGFNSSSSDLAIFDQIIWNINRINVFETDVIKDIQRKNYFRGHFSPILFLFAPLYWIWENVNIILLAQSVILGTGVFAVYRIAIHELKEAHWGVLFSFVYVLYPPIGFINRFDFHPVVFAIPLILFAWMFYGEKRLRVTSVCLALALCCKESVGLTIFTAGLVMVATHTNHRRFWLIWSLLSLTASLVAFFYIIPFFNKGTLPGSTSRYTWLGETPKEMIGQFVTHPWQSLTHQLGIDMKGRMKYLGELRRVYPLKMLFPFLFLPLLGGAIFLATLPVFVYNLLSSNINQASIYFQYNSPMIPFLFIGAILGFRRGLSWCSKKPRRWVQGLLGGLLLGCCLISFLHDNPFKKIVRRPYFQVFALQPAPGIEEFYQAAQLIPKEASVQANYSYAPHLSHRKEIYPLYIEEYFADYLILNVTDFRWHLHPSHVRKILDHPGYEMIYSKNNVVLLKKRQPVLRNEK